ncbi:Glycosyl Hydrolase Family 88 [Pedobacter sp. ok626]|uniref:glycoside hydrolase family 88 protein n=1 Tax=Pedobacter sp. ok626 TaxID=1761882 RepID=UPI000890D166|nr:glycoside hydrolase family 88 protein [Pedobacter sp. ok626]SDJ54041.1 Glycosyl Hydrolase Family 88 [Pedobacter sp. ok626]
MNLKKLNRVVVYVCMLLLCLSVGVKAQVTQPNINKVLHVAEEQYQSYLKLYPNAALYPRSINKDGAIRLVKAKDWTSGFFGGNLWYMFYLTKKSKWKDEAIRYTETLENEKYNKTTHDLGFVLYNTYYKAYHTTHKNSYKEVLLEASRSLSSRYSPKVGAIRSWDFKPFKYPVIVDNLMNLEMLLWASKISGDSSFYHIAVSHADVDLKSRFRPDNSTYHVLDFDPANGELIKKQTFQGYADSSCWARGQAWAIYAYTFLYRETRDPKYLVQAEKAANYFLSRTDLAHDPIPFWDFNDPEIPNVSKDASAAAVAASGLLELSTYAVEKDRYYEKAQTILSTLCTDEYLAKAGTNQYFLLKHSTGHRPHHDEIDVPLIYADYYFLEALYRYQHYKNLKGNL